MLNKMFQIVIGVMVMTMVLLPVASHAFSVTAEVDRDRISINDYLQLTVAFDGGDGDVDTASITDFQILSERSSSSVSIINGDYSKTVSTVFQLVPRREGRLAIPALPISHKGKIYHTRPIAITVTKASSAPEDTRDIFVRAELSPDRLYVGQQGIYRFQLFSAVQFTNARLQKPEFNGFTVEEMGEPRKFARNINGRRYNGVEIAYLVIPRTAGAQTIQPSQLTCDVAVREKNQRRDPFGDSFFANGFFSMARTAPRRFATRALPVEVMSLPSYEGEVPFAGLVGQFEVSAFLDKESLKVGESATLTVKVTGSGNVMDAGIPDPAIPDGLKVYEDAPVETVALTSHGYQGSKTFKRALVPISSGTFTVPSLGLTFFDPEKKLYQTVVTASMTLTAAPDDTGRESAVVPIHSTAAVTPETIPRQVDFTGRDILPLKESPGQLITRVSMSVWVFVLFYLLPFGLLFGMQAMFRVMKKGVNPRVALTRKADDCLKKGEKADGDDSAFLKHLYMAVLYRVLLTGKEAERSLTTAEACALLEKNGKSTKTIHEVRSVMHDIESARYGQMHLDITARNLLLERVQKVVKLICLVLMCSLVGMSSPSRAMAAAPAKTKAQALATATASVVGSPKVILLEAMSDYKAGRFATAAEKFVSLADRGIENGLLYYNAGNAFLKAGDTGRAILWYERARRFMPHDPDLRFNLAHAGTFVLDKPEASGIDWTGLFFFWKDYLPPRLMIWAAIGLSAVFALYAGLRSRQEKRIFTLAGFVFFMVVVLAGITVGYDYYERENGRFAVILAKEAHIRSGLSSEATSLFLLHAGTRVHVDERRDGYLKIIFSRDKIGWVRDGDVEMI